MATVTSLGASDSGATSRTTINTNFTNINTDLIAVVASDATKIGAASPALTGTATITNSTDAASNQALVLESDRATPAANDNVYASFKISDSAGNQDEFARIAGVAVDVTSTSEDGELFFSVMDAGSLSTELKLTALTLRPAVDDGLTLGNTNFKWSDIFLAEGAVINWDSSDLTLTQSGNSLTLAGGEFNFGSNTAYFTAQTATGDGTTTIDWKLGNKFHFTFGAFNETFTFTAPSGPCSLVLWMKQDGTGSRTATWPAAVHWSGGVAPTLTTTASRVDIITFYYDGSTYFGNSSLNYVA